MFSVSLVLIRTVVASSFTKSSAAILSDHVIRILGALHAQISSKPKTTTMDEEGFIQVDRRSCARQNITHHINPELSSSPNMILTLLNSEHDNAGLVHQGEGLDPNG